MLTNSAPRNILIVDDDSRNIFALKAVLKARGFTCMTSTSAREGIQLVEQNEVAVVLLDMMMPEMDGYETIKVLRQNPVHHEIPIIAVTAQAMAGDKEKCLEAGANAYVSKPIDIDLLISLMTPYLK